MPSLALLFLIFLWLWLRKPSWTESAQD